MHARIVLPAVLVALCTPYPSRAQEAPDPQTHVVTVTTLHVPFDKMDEYFDYVEKYNLPSEKKNPHILGIKYLVHNWGTNDPNIWIMTEYGNMGEIEKAGEWGDNEFESAYPDSAERESIGDEFTEKFGEYFEHHNDNILIGQVDRMK